MFRFSKPYLWLIRVASLIVPQRFRDEWKQEWEAEIAHREDKLEVWQRLDRESKVDLLRRSLGVFRDAISLQPRRLEDDMVQDLRYGARLLRHNPGLAIVTIMTLALGIGANTAIFSLINGVLMQPLPYPMPERLVRVWENPGSNPRNFVNPRNYADWRNTIGAFESAAAFYNLSLNLTGDGEPERVIGASTTAGFFSTLGVGPLYGRTFLPQDDQAGNERVIVLSHGLWGRRFGSDPNIIGQRLTLDGDNYTIIGVMPAGFHLPATSDLWRPLVFTPGMLADTARGSHYLQTVARLKPGMTVAQAQADLNIFYSRLREQYPGNLARWSVHAVPMLDDTVGAARPALWVLFGAVGLVLLIACANVAGLLVARGLARSREIAIRTALGAGPWRLIRQFLSESLLISFLGGAVGLLIGYVGLQMLIVLRPENLPRLDETAIDLRVLGFTLFASFTAALIAGLGPALSAARANTNEVLKESGARAGAGRRAMMWRRTLVVSEIALSLVLLAGAGLMIRSFWRVSSVSPGFRADGVLTMRVALPNRVYNGMPARSEFYRRVIENVRALPGIEASAFVNDPPVSGSEGLWENRFDIEGHPIPPPGQQLNAYLRWTTPDYFRTLGIPLLRGRLMDDSDVAERPLVTVIDERMAARYFPNEDPLGKRIIIYAYDQRPREIIGIVGAVRATALETDAEPHMYVPYSQTPVNYATLIARTTAEPYSLAAAIKGAVLAVDPRQPVYAVKTLEELIAETIAARRFNMLMLGLFAALALILSAVGVYGTISYSVGERTREIGVRLALGAQRKDILHLVVGQGMKLALIGVAIGTFGALATTRFLQGLLFGISPFDPLTLVAISILLTGVALMACYLPARRATRVDPMEALRTQ